MPVISIDGWATFISLTTSAPIGNLQVVLAIGSEEQMSYLKRIKNLTIYRHFLREPLPNLPIASLSAFSQQSNFVGISENQQQQQYGIGSLPALTQSLSQPTNDSVNRKAQLAARLNSFIENLASELPDQLTKVNPAIGVGMGNYMNLKSMNTKHEKTASQQQQQYRLDISG